MRFLTGSHREGGLGAGIVLGGGPDVLGQYPKLLDFYDLSPPLSYEPGDATVHSGFMVHGAPKNQSNETRWSYIMSYFPADVRFTRRPIPSTPYGADQDEEKVTSSIRQPVPTTHLRRPRRTIWMSSTRSSALEHHF